MERSNRKERLVEDFYELELPKAKDSPESHSFFGLLFLGLKVLDPNVTQIEARPERIRGANGKAFVPSARYRTRNGRDTYVVICGAANLLSDQKRLEPLLSAFASARGASYEFVRHEDLESQRHFAWLGIKISRWAQQYADESLSRERELVLRELSIGAEATLEALLLEGADRSSKKIIGAICWLLIEGELELVDQSGPFDLRTKVRRNTRFVSSSTGEPHG